MLTRLILMLAVLGAAAPASGGPILADFRQEAWFPYFLPHSPPMVLEALGVPIDGAPDLDVGAYTATNPIGFSGGVDVDLSSQGRITLTGRQSFGDYLEADYERAVITISNIVFSGKRVIAGVNVLDGIGVFDDPGSIFAVEPIVMFTGNSVTIVYDIATAPGYHLGDWFTFREGRTSEFQLQVVPEASSVVLLLLGLGGLSLRRVFRARVQSPGRQVMLRTPPGTPGSSRVAAGAPRER